MGDYWRRVGRRAARETAVLLHLDSWGRNVITAVIGVVILIALGILGSEDAYRDEVITAFAVIGGIALLFPLIYLCKLVSIPAQMQIETEVDKDKLRAEINERPRAMFSITTERDKTCIRIDNSEADATFTVKVSYPDRGSMPLPENPVHAQWSDYSIDTSRFIQAGGYDSVILFRSEIDQTSFLKTLFFLWVSRGHQFERRSTSWMPMKNNDTVPPSGEIEVFISADPPMLGGSRVLHLGFVGDQVSVISGEARLQTRLN